MQVTLKRIPMKVQEILKQKNRENITLPSSASVIEALKKMAEAGIGSIVVMDGSEYRGIMTERDYSRKVILQGKNSTDTKLGDIMSTQLPELAPDDELDAAMQHMNNNKDIRYLPVVCDGKMIGIISMSDLVSAKIERQKEEIGHLRDYISAK